MGFITMWKKQILALGLSESKKKIGATPASLYFGAFLGLWLLNYL